MCCPSLISRPSGDDGDPVAPIPPEGTTVGCPCTVFVRPPSLTFCGAGGRGLAMAAGHPAGGTFAWDTSDPEVVTVRAEGDTAIITSVGEGAAVVVVTYTHPGGATCREALRVKVCTCTLGRKYAGAYMRVADIVGIKARIRTRYPRLCCEGVECGKSDAFSTAYAGIADFGAVTKWAQVGFTRRRNEGSTTIIQYRKAEVQGETYNLMTDTKHAPAEGATHEHRCELDRETGAWSFYDDGELWHTYADAAWEGAAGSSASWTGEVLNREDDMPGTEGDKCVFTECQYRAGGGEYQDAGIEESHLGNDDSDELGVERVSGTAINIWDRRPRD